jgi:hypothetical protein
VPRGAALFLLVFAASTSTVFCITQPSIHPIYAQTIFQHSRECDTVLVQKAIMAMMRLCQRLLPYKAADISEPLMRGIQLLSLVDEQVRAAVEDSGKEEEGWCTSMSEVMH